MITLDEGAQQNAVPQNPEPESADVVTVAFLFVIPEGDLLLSLPLFFILSGAKNPCISPVPTQTQPHPQSVIPSQPQATIPSASKEPRSTNHLHAHPLRLGNPSLSSEW
jgi:hypothetical protein